MAIQFNPPDTLIRDYINRPSPSEQATAGVQQALQSYVQMKALQSQQELARESRDIDLAKLRAEGGSTATDYLNAIRKGRGLPALGPLDLGGTAPTPAPAAPTQAMPEAPEPNFSSQAEGPQAVTPMGSPIISHWNQSMGGPGASQAPMTPQKPTPPALGSDPALQEFNRIGAQEYIKKYGTGGMAKVKTALDIEKGLQDKASTTVNGPQYAALQSGRPEDIESAFHGALPSNLAAASLSATARNVQVMPGPTGAPIRVSKAGGPAEMVEVPGISTKTNPIQSKLNPGEYKLFQSEVNDFDKDKTVQDNRVALSNIGNVESMLAGYNPALTGPIASRQARAIAGEVGALTDSDIARQTLDPSLLGRLKKTVDVALTGKLPQDQLDLLRDSIAAIKRGAQGRIRGVASERAQRLSNNFGGKVSVDEIMGSLNLPSNFSPAPLPDMHDKAIAWANANPNDPRAVEILKKAQMAKGGQ